MEKSTSPGALALNCIVDDSALIAGLRDDGVDGIKHWVSDGLVNIFVPLYALDQLNTIRARASNEDGVHAQETLEWLDHITSSTENNSVGRVQLQGPDHQYQTWQEVERFLLPDTPLSSDLSPKMTRLSINASHRPHSRRANDIANDASSIPPQVRPLLNFVVWRTQNSDPTLQVGGRYLLLTNDRVTQKQASKFGVRAKMIGQLQKVLAKGNSQSTDMSDEMYEAHEQDTDAASGASDTPAMQETHGPDAEEEDEIVFHPHKKTASKEVNVLDPDHFGRSPTRSPHTGHVDQSSSPAQRPNRGRHSAPGSPNLRGRSVRGRGTQIGSRAKVSPQLQPAIPTPTSQASPTLSFRGPFRSPSSPNNGRGSMRGRGVIRGTKLGPVPRSIDPDSFARPQRMRGRGNRLLWEPS